MKGYLWVIRNPGNGEVFFLYDGGSRSQKTAMILLRDFRGAIQSDGYQVYNRLENLDGKLMLSGCWAYGASSVLPENNKLATEALLQIQSLYAIERRQMRQVQRRNKERSCAVQGLSGTEDF